MGIFSTLRGLFQKAAPDRGGEPERERTAERLRISLDAVVGKRVLVVNNSDKPWVGTLTGLDDRFGKPMVVTDDGTLYHVGGVVMPYSVELEEWLRSLGLKRGWEILFQMACFHNNLKSAQMFHRELKERES